MKIAIVNGSPRKGNTVAAIEAFMEGASGHEIEVIEANELNLKPCQGCGACQCTKGCVAKDDTNAMVDKLVAADIIVFATPVYWWGMTAQLKLVIDKCYAKAVLLKNKKAGMLVVGGSPVGSVQYDIMKTQFECIAKYLSWDNLFYEAYAANGKEDLKKSEETLSAIKKLGKDIA